MYYIKILFILGLGVIYIDGFQTLELVKSFTSSEDQTKAAQALLYRFLGNRSQDIDVVVDSANQEYVHVRNFKTSSMKI